MTIEPWGAHDVLALLETQLPPGTLNDVKRTVFRGAWRGLGYAQIAEDEDYDADYLREVGASLWRSLSRLMGQKATKRNFRTLLIQWLSGVAQQRVFPLDASAIVPPSAAVAVVADRMASCDWDEAPDVSLFFGRQSELKQLTRWSTGAGSSISMPVDSYPNTQANSFQVKPPKGPCRLIVLLGMGGMGKTYLAAKLAQQIQTHFEAVVWRSLRNAPPLEELMGEVVGFLSQQQSVSGNQHQLVNLLRHRRCLLIFDNAETLLEGGQSGQYRSGYEAYGSLFRALGEASHQSCVVITSREKLVDVACLEGEKQPVRSLMIGGSAEVTQALLERSPLQGSAEQQMALCQACGYSPLALKLVATTIQELFGGSIGDFLAEEVLAFDGLRRLLDEHIQRLSPLEFSILAWLAINREWTSLAMLQEDLVPTVPKSQVLNALVALRGRSLVEVRNRCYSLQSTVMEYMTEAIISRMLVELCGDLNTWLCQSQSSKQGMGLMERAVEKKQFSLPLLHSHALIKATAQAYVYHSQIALILQPVAQYLLQWAGSKASLQKLLQVLLKQLRPHRLGSSGYCGGNLLNLAIEAKLDLSSLDFSQLTLRQAQLRQAQLHRLNVSEARFVQSAFTQIFGSILCLDFSPDGQHVATGDALGQVQIWDLRQGQLQASYGPLDGRVHCLAFSPNGQYLAAGGDQGQVELWDVKNAIALGQLPGHERFVWSLAWGPSGQWLVSGGGDRTLRFWSVLPWIGADNARALSTSPSALEFSFPQPEAQRNPSQDGLLRIISSVSSWIHTVAVSPDGELVVSGSSDGALRLWDVATGQYLGVLLGHRRWVCAVAFSPDGQTIASASHDGDLRLWDTESGDLRRCLSGHCSPVLSLAFSPDGRSIVSASQDQTLRLWDLDLGHCYRTFSGHGGGVQAVAFSPDGQTLASGGHDHTLRLWDVDSGSCLHLLQGYAASLRCVDWHPDGHRLVSSNGHSHLWIWNTLSATSEPTRTYSFDHGGLWIARWAAGGQQLITASKDHNLRLIDGRDGRIQATLGEHRSWVSTLRISPDGETLVSGSADHDVLLWEHRRRRLRARLKGHSGRVCTVSFSVDGRHIFSGGADHSIRQWSSDTGEYLRPFNGHSDWVTAVGASPQGAWLASGSLDRQLKLWDLSTGSCWASLVSYRRPITDLAWHPDGQKLATCATDHEIHLWDWSLLEDAVHSLIEIEKADVRCEAEERSSEEGFATVSSELPEAISRCYKPLIGHEGAVWSIAFSPDGCRLASASEDGSCKIWDSQTGDCLTTLQAPSPYEGMNIWGLRGLPPAQLSMLCRLGAVQDGLPS